MRYIHVHRLTELPDISGLAPFKAILSVEEMVSPQRMEEVSTWLIEMGCRYVMCRGEGCDSWCDAVRYANLEIFDLDTMSVRDFVMTTGHHHESLKAVFWYAKRMARHPMIELTNCVVLHFGAGSRSTEYQSIYHRA